MVFGIDKVLTGIVKYHQTVRSGMVEQFKRVRDNPIPSVLMYTCMDSRMIPSRFTQTNVGEMFIVRNAGVLIPHHKYYGSDATITTEPGAMELACVINAVQDVIVCGHSDCKAMNLLQNLRSEGLTDPAQVRESPLRSWLLRYGGDSWTHFETMLRAEKNRLVFMEGHHAHEAVIDPKNQFVTADKFSQVSTLHQLENITSYPFMQRLVDGGLVRLHAMWFDIYTGNIFYFSKPHKMFVEITEENWDDFLDEKEREAISKQKEKGVL
ncbi:beta carbonic anhydrase 1-like isoform X2 [Paramacrobiotus metropolitanus]|uniref:beta carbonic anhydrase 1-like isoform X2 n=1 Tax=Paramacrobiotus metropolitanus TaxID=2943436 RepID=UPI002445E270|nr:beta carbonic anhydrase 1-like isoform X2 [Paramacrobiotus metropolitanus]